MNKQVSLCPEAFVVDEEEQEIMKFKVEDLQEEGRKLIVKPTGNNNRNLVNEISGFFLKNLLLKPSTSIVCPIAPQYINKLLQEMERMLDQEPMLVKVKYGLYTGKNPSQNIWRYIWTIA